MSEKVPRQVPKESCQQVPRQSCSTQYNSIPKESCSQVPRQKCQSVPRKECKKVPIQVNMGTQLFAYFGKGGKFQIPRLMPREKDVQ